VTHQPRTGFRLGANSAHPCIDFIARIAFVLEQLLRANVKRFSLGPVEKPSETVRLSEQGMGIVPRLGSEVRIVGFHLSRLFPGQIQADVSVGDQKESADEQPQKQ
jgi:ABC-type hemin transport system substrate-binding protein